MFGDGLQQMGRLLFTNKNFKVTEMKTTLQTLWERDVTQGFQTRTGPRRRTVKTGNRNENRFFKNKESDFLLIP